MLSETPSEAGTPICSMVLNGLEAGSILRVGSLSCKCDIFFHTTMYCHKCGIKLIDRKNYCYKCGTPIVEPAGTSASLGMHDTGSNSSEVTVAVPPNSSPPSIPISPTGPPNNWHPEFLTPGEKACFFLVVISLTIVLVGLIVMGISGEFSSEAGEYTVLSSGARTGLVFVSIGSILIFFSAFVLFFVKQNALTLMESVGGTRNYWSRLLCLSNGKSLDKAGIVVLGYANLIFWCFLFAFTCGIVLFYYGFRFIAHEDYSEGHTRLGEKYRIYPPKGLASPTAKQDSAWGVGEEFAIKERIGGGYHGIDPATGKPVKIEDD